MKTGMITLTVPEAKRLIARGVAELPQVKHAMANGIIVISGGTTNGYVAEELTGKSIDKVLYTAGIICNGRGCVTDPGQRLEPVVLEKGAVSNTSWTEALEKMQPGDVFIKGGNAVDIEGHVGVMLGSPVGGTIGKALGTLSARGIELVAPVGNEKLVPSVIQAAGSMGIGKLDYSHGLPCGMQVLTGATVVDEVEAVEMLSGCAAIIAAGGGVGDSQGAVTLTFSGEQKAFDKAIELLEKVKGEQPVPGDSRDCPCAAPCDYGKSQSTK